jgi:L-2,4-diaminobutyric acid acetyltransferase
MTETQTSESHTKKPASAELRKPVLADGAAVCTLIRNCPPLDVNSCYCYFLLCSHFADTSVVAESDGSITGFISAYLEPTAPDTVFVWQVAVDASQRGTGLAGRMLDAIVSRPECAGVRWLETTVSPSNHASRRLFERFAERHGARLEEQPFLEAADFGDSGHEAEPLLRIGPLGGA